MLFHHCSPTKPLHHHAAATAFLARSPSPTQWASRCPRNRASASQELCRLTLGRLEKSARGEIWVSQSEGGTEQKSWSTPGSAPLVSLNEWEGMASTTPHNTLHPLPTREVHPAPLHKAGRNPFLDHDQTFFFPSLSLPQTPAVPEQRCSYSLARTQLPDVPRLHLPHGNGTRREEAPGPRKSSAEVFMAPTADSQERQTLGSCWRCARPWSDPTANYIHWTVLNQRKPCRHDLL